MTIRVAIAEDQGLLLDALAALLALEPGLDVVATAADGHAALAVVDEHAPDVLLADVEMPGRTGLEVAEALRRDGSATRVVVLTTFARPGYLRRALAAGVAGYVLKDAPVRELADAVRHVHAGGRSIAPELAATSWDPGDPLTDREREVLRLVAEGRSNAQVAAALHLADGTVRNHVSSVLAKLHAANRTAAVRIATEQGWI